MPNSLQSQPVRDLLNRLFEAAEGDDPRRVRLDQAHPDGFGPTSAREQSDAYEEIYIPVSPEAGRVIADDTISLAAEMGNYLGYVRDPANGYLSVLFPDADGLEITCRA
jgi:hypothetical protein